MLEVLRQFIPPGRSCFSITTLLQGLLLANGPTGVGECRKKREMEQKVRSSEIREKTKEKEEENTSLETPSSKTAWMTEKEQRETRGE